MILISLTGGVTVSLLDKIRNAKLAANLSSMLIPERKRQDEIVASIAVSLIKERKLRNWTQTDMAKYLGVSQSMVSKWESAEYNFTIEALVEIAVKLDMSISNPLNNSRNVYRILQRKPKINYEDV